MVLDENGTVKEALMYQPYGTVSDVQGISVAGTDPLRQKFTTKEFDEEGDENGAPGIDAYHFGFRVYDPDIGVWMSTDPKDQLFNSYGYSTNPLITVDPDGRSIIGAVVLGLIGAYGMGALANGSLNPGQWEWDDAETWSSVIGGASIGASLGNSIENGIINAYYNAHGSVHTAYGARAVLSARGGAAGIRNWHDAFWNRKFDRIVRYVNSKNVPIYRMDYVQQLALDFTIGADVELFHIALDWGLYIRVDDLLESGLYHSASEGYGGGLGASVGIGFNPYHIEMSSITADVNAPFVSPNVTYINGKIFPGAYFGLDVIPIPIPKGGLVSSSTVQRQTIKMGLEWFRKGLNEWLWKDFRISY
jgi:RHS repeat-associated protein